MEVAAAGGIDGAGDFPGEDDAPGDLHRVGRGGGREKGLCVRVAGVFVELDAVGDFDDFAQVHNGDAVAEMFDDGEVMGDEEVGEFQFVLEVGQEV